MECATIAPMRSPGPARRRRALLPAGRHRPPSVLVGLYLTWQIEIRLNCQVLGLNAPFDFIIARVMPVLAGLFPAA